MDYPALFNSVSLALLVLLQITLPSKASSLDQQNWEIFGERAQVPSFYRGENRTTEPGLDVLSATSDQSRLQLLKRRLGVSRRRKRAITRRLHYSWPSNTVPYTIDSNEFDATDSAVILEAIQEWMKHTCLVFRPASSQDQRRIVFKDGDKCGFEGRPTPSGPQTIFLEVGCRYKDIIMHEIGHAIGFEHEHQRPDRDNHVTIDQQNIERGLGNLFQKLSSSAVNTHNSPYDLKSIMHFGREDFSKNNESTIIAKNPNSRDLIGQAQETGKLSFWDIKVANEINNCAARCCQKSCPGDGFLGEDCKCWCPGNPVRLCTSGPVTRQCGIANKVSTTARIFRGRVSKIGVWPWVAFVEQRVKGDRFAICGGTFIGEDWVLTAAHCVYRRHKSSLKVYLGKHYASNARDDASVQEYQVSEVHMHPDFNYTSVDADIALLRLSACVRITNRVSPICLPSLDAAGSRETESHARPGQAVTVIGWGLTEALSASEVLREADLQTITNALCKANYEKAGQTRVVITGNKFCAGGRGGLVDACNGDSGGPVMASTGTGSRRRWYPVGVVNQGPFNKCGVPGLYGVYTRLSPFLTYIANVTRL